MPLPPQPVEIAVEVAESSERQLGHDGHDQVLVCLGHAPLLVQGVRPRCERCHTSKFPR
jgi:hypothetical protein